MATAVTPQVALLRLCSECGEPIPTARLKAKPNARQCVPCLEQMGDVPVYRRVEEQAGQVEKLFKDAAKSADADKIDAECVFSTDDEEASGDTVTAPIVADVPAHELDELNVGSSDVEAHPVAQNKSDTIDPNYRGQVRWNAQRSRWELVFHWHTFKRVKFIGTKERFPTRYDASRAAESLREWFRNHPEVFTRQRPDESEYEGSVWFDKKIQQWKLLWNEHGQRAARVIGTLEQYPTKEQASLAAEPIRNWFRTQRYVNATNLREEHEAIAADVAKAKREESDLKVEALFNALAKERDQRHYYKVAETVLGIYLDRKDTAQRTGGIRAMRYDDWTPPPYQNPGMERATVSDFIADIQIAARAVLTLPLHIALFRLVYIESRYSVEHANKVYPQVLYDMHAFLGKEFVRRGISPTHEYFRPFKQPKHLR